MDTGVYHVRDHLQYFGPTPVTFGMVKEAIMEILEECSGAICTDILAIVGAHTFSFHDFHALISREFFGEKDRISSRR